MNMDARLVYHTKKSLGIISGEIFKCLDLIAIREDGFYQTDARVRGKGRVDQPFPGGRIARRENTISSRMDDAGTSEKLTKRGEFARLPKFLGASEGLYPSTV